MQDVFAFLEEWREVVDVVSSGGLAGFGHFTLGHAFIEFVEGDGLS